MGCWRRVAIKVCHKTATSGEDQPKTSHEFMLETRCRKENLLQTAEVRRGLQR